MSAKRNHRLGAGARKSARRGAAEASRPKTADRVACTPRKPLGRPREGRSVFRGRAEGPAPRREGRGFGSKASEVTAFNQGVLRDSPRPLPSRGERRRRPGSSGVTTKPLGAVLENEDRDILHADPHALGLDRPDVAPEGQEPPSRGGVGVGGHDLNRDRFPDAHLARQNMEPRVRFPAGRRRPES